MKTQVKYLRAGDKVKFMTGMGTLVADASVPVWRQGYQVCILKIEVNGHVGHYYWKPNTTIKIHNIPE